MWYEYEEKYKKYLLLSTGWDITAPRRDGIMYTVFIYEEDMDVDQRRNPLFTTSCFLSGIRLANLSDVEKTRLKKGGDEQKLLDETKRKIDKADFTDKLDIKYE